MKWLYYLDFTRISLELFSRPSLFDVVTFIASMSRMTLCSSSSHC